MNSTFQKQVEQILNTPPRQQDYWFETIGGIIFLVFVGGLALIPLGIAFFFFMWGLSFVLF